MNKIFIVILFAALLTSCFKEDEPVLPNKGESVTIQESIYTHQSFFDLAGRNIVSVNPLDKWDLGFESSDTGWHVIINSGRYLGVYSSGTTDFDGLTSVPSSASWKYDKSDGDPDSTAIGEWFSGQSGLSLNLVYVVGVNDGITYLPLKKIVFKSLQDGIYTFHYSNMDGTDQKDFSISKDFLRNFVYFSFSEGGKQVIVEPEKTAWDLVFTQYSTTLYTDEGIPTPYFVRGVLINMNGVEVALDTLTGFSDFAYSDIRRQQFSKSSDAIGYDWKSVKIDGTSADYAIRQNYTYIIRSNSGSFYKLRFTGFYNDLGSPGYPRFEILTLF